MKANQKNLIIAYELFKDEIDIIDMIADNDFISVTQFAQLLNTVLDINCIEPLQINYLLRKNGILSISNNPFNKYDVSDKVLEYCKEISFYNGYFYIWDPKLLFTMLNIGLNQPITKASVQQLCCVIKPYVFEKLDKNIIFNHLKLLQLIISHNTYYY